jgi:hypothetical protein
MSLILWATIMAFCFAIRRQKPYDEDRSHKAGVVMIFVTILLVPIFLIELMAAHSG